MSGRRTIPSSVDASPAFLKEAKHLYDLSRLLYPHENHSLLDYYELTLESVRRSADIQNQDDDGTVYLKKAR